MTTTDDRTTMEVQMKEKVAEAVSELRGMLQLDGADLLVDAADDTSATFAIVLEDANCADCVLPPAMIQSILAKKLSTTLPQITEVTVRDPRDEVAAEPVESS